MKRREKYKGHYDIDVNGIKFTMLFDGEAPTRERDERIAGVREPQTECLLKVLVKPTDNILELGSCYGYFTLMLSQLASSGHVYACEPDKHYLKFLRANVKLNGCGNVSIHPVFVGDGVFDGETELAENKVTGAHVISDGFWPVDIVFMDIEAHEVFVIPEMLRTEKRPRIIMFQPHCREYGKYAIRDKFEKLLELLAVDYRVMKTQQMIVGLRK